MDEQPAKRNQSHEQELTRQLLSSSFDGIFAFDAECRCTWYAERGGCITVKAAPEGTDAVIEVSDTGIGIPQAMLVAVTGRGQAQYRRQSMDAGFDHHLTKPVDAGQIQALVASATRR